MSPLEVEVVRGSVVESVHRVSVAVVHADGRVLAAGHPELTTFWRSAAKPFQALPLVADGAAERFGLDDRELALACASHSSEPVHLELVDGFLAKIGCTERDLACGPHPPLSAAVAAAVARGGVALTPRWSNCSGKHAGMLALARHHGWPLAGYERAGHPVQERILDEIVRWTGVPRQDIGLGVDGCAAVCFALPLTAMARAYARLAGSAEPGARRIRGAMAAHPELVAGSGRPCTALAAALPGRLIAKVGAEGVYGAAFLGAGIGVALKVEDGSGRAAGPALVHVLQQVADRMIPDLAGAGVAGVVSEHAEPPIRNTRGAVTGWLRARGTLRFYD
ncbi:MAG TPA: asparaginase [Gemmatimonadales bacterium]|nr:asparaginase [Gemmatimonadales bacterium]